MNLERLRVEGVPMVCLNGALDKVPEKRRRLGSSRLLSAPLCPSRLLSAPLGSSLPLSAHLWLRPASACTCRQVTSGYYSNFLNPELGRCSDRFFTRFEQAPFPRPPSPPAPLRRPLSAAPPPATHSLATPLSPLPALRAPRPSIPADLPHAASRTRLRTPGLLLQAARRRPRVALPRLPGAMAVPARDEERARARRDVCGAALPRRMPRAAEAAMSPCESSAAAVGYEHTQFCGGLQSWLEARYSSRFPFSHSYVPTADT